MINYEQKRKFWAIVMFSGMGVYMVTIALRFIFNETNYLFAAIPAFIALVVGSIRIEILDGNNFEDKFKF